MLYLRLYKFFLFYQSCLQSISPCVAHFILFLEGHISSSVKCNKFIFYPRRALHKFVQVLLLVSYLQHFFFLFPFHTFTFLVFFVPISVFFFNITNDHVLNFVLLWKCLPNIDCEVCTAVSSRQWFTVLFFLTPSWIFAFAVTFFYFKVFVVTNDHVLRFVLPCKCLPTLIVIFFLCSLGSTCRIFHQEQQKGISYDTNTFCLLFAPIKRAVSSEASSYSFPHIVGICVVTLLPSTSMKTIHHRLNKTLKGGKGNRETHQN